MTCDELRPLLHGYLDGELDPAHCLDVDRHIGECAACAAALEQFEELRPALRDRSLVHPPPAGLEERIRASVRAAEPERRPSRSRRRMAVAVAVLLAGVGGWVVGRFSRPSSADETLAREVVAAHIRASMPGHLTDVVSGDRHDVKPWFNGRIDFSPPIKDLSERGFLLVGGRLDYLDDRPVAAIVYRCRKHEINLFVWPADRGGDVAPRPLTRQGYHLVHWVAGGLAFWAVSDVQEPDLLEFARLMRE